MTVEQAVKEFFADRAVYCADKTLKIYSGHLQIFLQYLEERYGSISKLTFEALPDNLVPEYILYLRRDYHDITNTTIRSYVRPVSALLRFCYEQDICKDFLKRIKLPKDDAIPPAPLLQEEVDRLDAVFDLETLQGLRNYCIVHLMLDCGLRSQEVRHLQVSDLDPDHNLVYIRISKECKSRITMIPDFLLQKIKLYLSRSEVNRGSVFHSLRGKEDLSENAIKQLFQDLKHAADLPRLHAHLLRHTFGTSYLVYGGNLEFLRVLMGHSDYNVTKGYVSLAAQYKMLGVKVYRLDDLFFRH